MRRFTVVLIGLLALPVESLAQQGANFSLVSPPAPARRYGMAGCGLGSVLLPNGPQAMTSVINGLFWNQVFVISSGTSNCQSDTTQQVGAEQEHFMKNNFRTIAKEAAQGDGETLAGLANTFGCPQQSEKDFAEFTQKNHQKIFSQPGAIAALHALRKELSTDNALVRSCTLAALPNTPENVR
ncbi:MAG: hypothetical protein RI932_2470 [Pseudomonadota bacterium]|jgi:hypothetical protein